MLSVRWLFGAMVTVAAVACVRLYPSEEVLAGARDGADAEHAGAAGAAMTRVQNGQAGLAGSDPGGNADLPASAGASGHNAACRDLGCSSADCDGAACDNQGRQCNGGSCVCPGGDEEQACTNSKDDDCDDKTDCADADCDGKICEADGRKCSKGTCACPSGQTKETNCSNSTDDDCDGKTDCADTDCKHEACAGGGRCCGTSCVKLTSNSNCGACGISCGSGYSCQANHSHPDFYVCSCATNEQCRTWGYGADATCWSSSGQTQCNCQCNSESGTTCTGQCKDDGKCHMMVNENYCSY